jgi:hypothetical protein
VITIIKRRVHDNNINNQQYLRIPLLIIFSLPPVFPDPPTSTIQQQNTMTSKNIPLRDFNIESDHENERFLAEDEISAAASSSDDPSNASSSNDPPNASSSNDPSNASSSDDPPNASSSNDPPNASSSDDPPNAVDLCRALRPEDLVNWLTEERFFEQLSDATKLKFVAAEIHGETFMERCWDVDVGNRLRSLGSG